MARKKRYDRVAPDSENEFLYQVWRRQQRRKHAKFQTLEEMQEALERGEIEVEKLPSR